MMLEKLRAWMTSPTAKAQMKKAVHDAEVETDHLRLKVQKDRERLLQSTIERVKQ